MAKIVKLKGRKIFTWHNITCTLWMLAGLVIVASGVYGVFTFGSDNYQIISAVFIVCGILMFTCAYVSMKDRI